MQKILLSLVVVLSISTFSGVTVGQDEEATLFDNVTNALQKRFVNKEFREQQLPEIVDRYRERAADADTLNEQRQVVHDLLSNLPATHMGLLSKSTYQHLIGELGNKLSPTFGFELMELDGKQFVTGVLEGGPGQAAGIKRGDRIVLIDGDDANGHKRLDWRSDDSFLPDPPVRRLQCEEGDTVKFLVEAKWGEFSEIEVTAQPYSSFEAAKASAMVIESGDKKFGYIHFWLIHFTGVATLLKEKLEGDFADCDALILDLRGRGGNGAALQGIYDVLSGKNSNWTKPVVALVNQHSRSAKEVMAYEMRRQKIALVVGERTAGAVIPATFADVGHDTMLMFPTFKFGDYTGLLEGIGAEPDVLVQDAGPYSEGADPLLGAGLREANRLAGAQAEGAPGSER